MTKRLFQGICIAMAFTTLLVVNPQDGARHAQQEVFWVVLVLRARQCNPLRLILIYLFLPRLCKFLVKSTGEEIQ
jgi:hypothetical protein